MITDVNTELGLPDIVFKGKTADPEFNSEGILPRAILKNGKPDTNLYSKDDPPAERPRRGALCEVYVYDLSKKEDIEAYKEILTLIGTSAFYKIRHNDRRWDDKTGNWKVLLEVVEYVDVSPLEE